MAINKCLKCGADIPEGAGFCPSCGAPKGAQAAVQASQQGQPKMKQTTPTPQPRQPMPAPGGAMRPQNTSMGLGPMMETLFSTMLISIGLFVCILIAFIGKIYMMSDLNSPMSLYIPIIGLNGIGTILLFGGFFNKSMNPALRAGMIAGGGIMLTFANIPSFEF